jgi:DNA-binding FadR family transcriptional regulator
MRRALADRAARRSGIEELVDADIAFHRSIVIAAHNPILTEPFDVFVPRSRQTMIEMLRLRRDFGGDPDQGTHASLLAAVAARDSKAAAGLSRSHLQSLKAALT